MSQGFQIIRTNQSLYEVASDARSHLNLNKYDVDLEFDELDELPRLLCKDKSKEATTARGKLLVKNYIYDESRGENVH